MEEREQQQTTNQDLPEQLYHYTTQEGLLGIIEKQELWATDVRFLNDMEEFEAGLKTAIRLSEQAAAEAGDDGRKIVDYLERILRFSFTERPVYSVSLTGPLKKYETLPDSIDDPGDRLNMWRGYSARGIAYSIGLPRGEFSVNIDGVDLQECSYRQDTKEEYLTEALNQFGDLLNECNRKGIDKLKRGISYQQAMDEMRNEVDKKVSKILPDLKSQIAACKHESFWEEREWRLTVAPPPDHENLFYSSGRFGITPRFRIALRDSDGLLPIKRIVVGPTPHAADALDSLREFLIRNKYTHLQISSSKVPYRNW
ncbi:MAG: DUF2971 domain-containing protein [Terracidiphilus sp.]